MTPFELRLSTELRAYVEAADLDRAPEAVVDDVLAMPSRRGSWRIPAGIAAAVLIVAGAAAGIRALDGMASRPAEASVRGQTYGLAVVRSLEFASGDLSPYGEVSSSEEAYFADDTAYAVRGVDPNVALVVRLEPGLTDDAGPWGEWILLTRGPAPNSLCPYYDPESSFTPHDCLEEGE
jgi:hypothetical protein